MGDFFVDGVEGVGEGRLLSAEGRDRGKVGGMSRLDLLGQGFRYGGQEGVLLRVERNGWRCNISGRGW